MKLELHILQNFAPSNLNRDDTGAPKDCEFGGYRRARISSQCLKRAIRQAFEVHGLFTKEEMGTRTKRLVDAVADAMAKEYGYERDQALPVVRFMIEGAGLGIKDDGGEVKTEYLLFLPLRNVKALAAFVHRNWSVLKNAPSADDAGEAAASKKGKKKADAKAGFPKELASELRKLFEDAAGAPDLALFGRMIADTPAWNVEAACQVAHAISTNRMTMDFDFYTAVDDLRPGDTAGSDMMGTVQFNSACFYRYAVLDIEALAKNLGEDRVDSEATRRTVNAFLRASVLAIPTGKQNSMAAHNPPSYVMAVLRKEGAAVSLANAFVKPARATGDKDLVDASIAALEGYFGNVTNMYGSSTVVAAACADRKVHEATNARITRHERFDDVVSDIMGRAFGGQAA